MRLYTLAALALTGVLFASAAHAQTPADDAAAAPRLRAGITALGAVPTSDFGARIDRAFGVGAHVAYRLDSAGRVAVRLDADWLGHGWEQEDVALRSPLGGTPTFALSTTHSLMFFGVGPELSVPLGGIRGYVGANAGIAYFLTHASGSRWSRGVRLATSVEKGDAVFAYGGRAGVRIPVAVRAWPVAIDLGGQYQHSDEAEFLREGDLTVDGEGTITLDPVRAKADTWIFHVGVSVPLLR